MTEKGKLFEAGAKAWLAGAATASFALSLWALVEQVREKGASFYDAIVYAIVLTFPVFSMVAIATAIPSSLFLWLAQRMRFEGPVAFTAFGGVLGGAFWYFIPLLVPWQCSVIGAFSGFVAWFAKARFEAERP